MVIKFVKFINVVSIAVKINMLVSSLRGMRPIKSTSQSSFGEDVEMILFFVFFFRACMIYYANGGH